MDDHTHTASEVGAADEAHGHCELDELNELRSRVHELETQLAAEGEILTAVREGITAKEIVSILRARGFALAEKKRDGISPGPETRRIGKVLLALADDIERM